MLPQGDSLSFPTHITWDVDAWYSESLENKPFLDIDASYSTYVADPIMGRILIFDQQGIFLKAFGTYGSGPSEIGMVGGLAVSPDGTIWVSDALNDRLMQFPAPDLLNNAEDFSGQPIPDLSEPIEVDNGE
jgi:DNA-binding beta-propeller fold protein YncE